MCITRETSKRTKNGVIFVDAAAAADAAVTVRFLNGKFFSSSFSMDRYLLFLLLQSIALNSCFPCRLVTPSALYGLLSYSDRVGLLPTDRPEGRQE